MGARARTPSHLDVCSGRRRFFHPILHVKREPSVRGKCQNEFCFEMGKDKRPKSNGIEDIIYVLMAQKKYLRDSLSVGEMKCRDETKMKFCIFCGQFSRHSTIIGRPLIPAIRRTAIVITHEVGGVALGWISKLKYTFVCVDGGSTVDDGTMMECSRHEFHDPSR